MRVLPLVEERIRRVIRDARAKDPLITVFTIKLILEFNPGFSYPWSISILLATYVGVLGAVAACAGYAYSTVRFATDEGAFAAQRDKTVLDERISTAREIKESLRRQIPGPDPLAPITAS